VPLFFERAPGIVTRFYCREIQTAKMNKE